MECSPHPRPVEKQRKESCPLGCDKPQVKAEEGNGIPCRHLHPIPALAWARSLPLTPPQLPLTGGFRQPVVLPIRAFLHFPKCFLSTCYIPDLV